MMANKVDEETIKVVCKIIDEVSFAGTDSVVPDTIEGKLQEHLHMVVVREERFMIRKYNIT